MWFKFETSITLKHDYKIHLILDLSVQPWIKLSDYLFVFYANWDFISSMLFTAYAQCECEYKPMWFQVFIW